MGTRGSRDYGQKNVQNILKPSLSLICLHFGQKQFFSKKPKRVYFQILEDKKPFSKNVQNISKVKIFLHFSFLAEILPKKIFFSELMRRYHALRWHKFELSLKFQENPFSRSGDMAITGERKEEPTHERTNGTTIKLLLNFHVKNFVRCN